MNISTQFLIKILFTFNSDFIKHLKTKKILYVYMWVLFPQGSDSVMLWWAEFSAGMSGNVL